MGRRFPVLATGFILAVTSLVALSVAFDSPGYTAPAPVVLIVMENHEYDAVRFAPYLSDFASRGILFTNYHANTHPSLPNYMAMTSGKLLCNGSDSCATNSFDDANVFRQLGSAGIGWRAYEESMPSRCARSNSGLYLVRHNPPPYYSNLAKTCPQKDVPYPSPLPAKLKPFTFVTPNACNDMHDCSVTTGDNWLANHVPAFLGKGAVVVIVFDEGSTSDGGGGHIYAAAVGPGISAGQTDATAYSHYSLLAGVEDYFGVPRLAGAIGKAPLPFDDAAATSPPPTSPPPTAYGPQATIACPVGAVAVPAGASISAAVSANPAGTAFCLGAGTFTVGSPIVPKTGDSFTGTFGAVLDGSTMADVANTGVFLAQNVDVDDVTIRNLVIRNATRDGIRAYRDFSDGWVVDHNELVGNRIGIEHGNSFTITANDIHDNWQYGIGGYRSTGSVIEGNEFSLNASRVLSFPGDSANSKWTETTNTTVRGNYVHDNYWSGIWFDGENTGFVIEDNIVIDNAGNGIFDEVSGQGVIRNNTIAGSSQRNVYISESHDAEVYGNTVTGSARGIALFQDGSRRFESELGNDYFHDNDVTVPAGGLAVSLSCSNLTSAECSAYSTSRNIRFEANSYVVPTLDGRWWFWAESSRTWNEWRSFGMDAAGTVST